MKICTTCKKDKELEEFYEDSKGTFFVSGKCKICIKEYKKLNPQIEKKSKQKFYQNHKKEILLKSKEWIQNNSIQKKINDKLYKAKDPDKHNNYNKKWNNINIIHIRNYRKNRYKNDPIYRTSVLLRSHFNHHVKGNCKSKSVMKLLGCSDIYFHNYIESKFENGMTWENQGEIWEYDHFYPISSFNINLLEEQEKCFHYTNYNPRFKTSDIAKKYDHPTHIGNRNKGAKIL